MDTGFRRHDDIVGIVMPGFAYMDVGGRAMQEQLPRPGIQIYAVTSQTFSKHERLDPITFRLVGRDEDRRSKRNQ